MANPAGTLPSGVAAVPRRSPAKALGLETRIVRGLVKGAVRRWFFARQQIPVGTWEQTSGWTTVASADVGGTPSLFPLPADGPVEIVSDNPVDNINGSGARTFVIIGPAAGGVPDTTPTNTSAPWARASVPLNGTTPSVTTTEFYGGLAEDGGVQSAGALFTNQGTLTCSRVSDGKILFVIPPTWGHTVEGRITVPQGWTAVIRKIIPWWNGDAQAHWRLRVHDVNGVRISEIGGSVHEANSGTEIDLSGGFVIPELSTFWFEAIRDAGGLVSTNYLTMASPIDFYEA